MTFAIGSLVSARGREWVVLPESDEEWLIARPLGGTDREQAGFYLPLEGDEIRPAAFGWPDPSALGDATSCRLLRDAVRLGFRSSAGPFRSFGRIAVEPRPYQLVPLLMALKLDPVRLLIADDVGIGKTVEAGLIARELIDRGEAQRLAVLCPPHLAEQWQSELADKFHIAAELVLPSTVTRLERDLRHGESLFDVHPFVIVSIDYIKQESRRKEFLRACPELVIVDEAHTCAYAADRRSDRHLRFQLLRDLARDHDDRHLILVTATPHSGDESAFRSLLGLMDERRLANLPDDLTGPQNERHRRDLATHMVQRRRADVRAYLGADTVFPVREEAEETYVLSDNYRRLFNAVLGYARERVLDPSGSRQRQRVRWWSALALLRSVASSPAAAAATLRSRSSTVDTADEREADQVGERTVLDVDDMDTAETPDMAPGAEEGDDAEPNDRERLRRLARQADELRGPDQDAKLRRAVELVRGLLRDGFQPIVFCRFIPTAEYVKDELRRALPATVTVEAVTGNLPPEEREQRVAVLGQTPQHVLVATDCLSEGINLQEHFDAVLHYDLSWNPTRHEQREGRVDRFGQPQPRVRALTYYGRDNPIDGVVLKVLINKHHLIRTSLGISVPVPASGEELSEALMSGLLLRGPRADARQLSLFDLGGFGQEDLHLRWEDRAAKEKRTREMFAQHALAREVDDLARREVDAVRRALGSGLDVQCFVEQTVRLSGGVAAERIAGERPVVELTLPSALRQVTGADEGLRVRFDLPVPEGTTYLTRTHPLVESLAAHVLDTALDPRLEGIARRAGAMRSRAVRTRTTLLLVRFRFHLLSGRGDKAAELLAEDCQVLGFAGAPDAAQWLPPEETVALLDARPDQNIAPAQAAAFVGQVVAAAAALAPALDSFAAKRGQEVLEAHRRVRSAARLSAGRYEIRAQTPVDVLGAYVILPMVG